MAGVRVNGQLLSDLGVDVELPDRLFAPDRSFPTVPIARRVGGFITGPALSAPMERTIRGTARPAAGTAAAREGLEADLEDLLLGGVVLQTDNGFGTVKEVLGVGLSLRFTPAAGALAPIATTFEWRLLCEDPTWRSPVPIHLALPAGVRVPVRVGTAASSCRIWVYGPTAASWTIVFRRFTGEAIATLTASGAEAQLAATDYAVIDIGDVTAVKYESGVAENLLPSISGDFPPAGLSPEDAHRASGAFPSVELSSGSGELWAWERWGR